MGQADLLVTFPPTRLAAQSSVDRQTIIPCLGTCTQPHKLTPPQPLSGKGWSLLGPNLEHRVGTLSPSWSKHWHTPCPWSSVGPAPSMGQHTPLPPRAGSQQHCSVWGWGAVGCVCVGGGSTLRVPSTAVKQRSPPSDQAERGGKGGSLGKERTQGGVLKTLSRPVVKAPAISLPCHWPATARPRGPHSQPHRVCACV